jgi:glycerol-3-phosphate O-acyltransferase
MRITRRGGLGWRKADLPEVAQLLGDKAFLAKFAPSDLGEVAGYLREMAAGHSERATRPWERFGSWLMRAYDILVDEDEIARFRTLDRRQSLAFLFSHRSYLDGFVLPHVLSSRGFSPTYTFGGANLNLPGIGALASNTGVIFIRRDTADLPLYRLTLRAFIGRLIANGRNVAWSIEGGRTRTGKLRPPVFGILRYIADAVDEGDGSDVILVPVSVVYDQLHEVAAMTAEARGARKRPEDLRWLVGFAREQRQRLGRAYVHFGEPVPLRSRLAELRAEAAEADGQKRVIERIAVDISHRINRATPVTVTAIVSLAVLGADRALTLDEVLSTVAPLAEYLRAGNWQVAGAANLTDRNTIRRALQELCASAVLTYYGEGTEPVWGVGPEQHLIAAFYRNTVIHVLVDRAIGEVALLTAAEDDEAPTAAAWAEALYLRDLLKFEFFFSGREEFEEEIRQELRILTPDRPPVPLKPGEATALLARVRPYTAHLVLRPFLDAYHVVADRLAAQDGERIDTEDLLAECLRVGRQWALQRRLGSAESVSLELFKTALRLAGHLGLLEETPGVGKRRREFAEQVRDRVRRVRVIAEMARAAGGVG